MKNQINLPDFIQVLGDPHLAKKFKTGVPLNRLGERETTVRKDFKSNLNLSAEIKVHVCVGDLFNAFRVPEEDILFAAKTYIAAANRHKKTQFIILQGNHDASRQKDLKSSFDVFTVLVSVCKNITVVDDAARVMSFEDVTLVFYPWHPFKNAEAIAGEVDSSVTDFWAFGHWDINSFGEDSSSTENLVPSKLLAQAVGVVTGHYHTPQVTKTTEGVPLWVVGSMQPYNHAEDPEGNLYITESLPSVKSALSKDIDAFKDKNLRLLLTKDEAPLSEINCLSLAVKRVQDIEAPNIDVDLATFDLGSIFNNTFKEYGCTEVTTKELWDEFLTSEEGDAE